MGTSASGQQPILVPVTSVSHESAASCGSRSQRSPAVWHTPAGTPARWSASMVSYAASVVRPFLVPRDLGQRAPFGVGEAVDGEPAIVAGAGIDVVGRRRLVRRAI